MDEVNKFWKEYYKAELFDRRNKIDVIMKNINEVITIEDKKVREGTLRTTLLGYFNDIEEYFIERSKGNI